ncbi:MAG: hypothetical protein HC845_01205 [Akkermansiaceae bacterium]|nr:hypothetical protein [Akkermansiaceae bacterium]
MIAEDTDVSLRVLRAEVSELKRSVEELRAIILVTKPELDRKTRVAQAKKEIFTEYDFLLGELAK